MGERVREKGREEEHQRLIYCEDEALGRNAFSKWLKVIKSWHRFKGYSILGASAVKNTDL